VIALAAGGALDIIEPGVTGWLIERQDVKELREAIRRSLAEPIDSALIRERAERFSARRFREEFREAVSDTVAGHCHSASR